MSATLNDIARKAGVSHSTVARVLRGDVKGAQKRSAEKSAEILRLSEELGYQPDWRARALSRRKTQTIGLLYSNPNWIFEDPMNEIAVSFTESLQKHNYDLRLIPANSEDHWKELVFGGAVDGLAMLLHIPEGTEEAISKSGLPTILLGDKLDDDVPHVVPDDVGGAYAATRHLIGLGHKHIVFYIDESIRPHVSVREREQGFRQAIEEAGDSVRGEVWNISTDEAIGRLLDSKRPTAMLGYCHVEALQITHAAWTHGISIPTDLSLIAFNDMMITRCMTPPLSVVGFDMKEMGHRGAEMLVQRIEHPRSVDLENIVLRQKLVIRGTTAPPGTRN
ncbi:LacI family DNA-binding transcriptional regulator [Bythopirellula polymerisocia]|uniref:HTH-type transcriptional regulator DegA n=1 Tax=Bythopirellula polymerisocia TaxID=2528003 RepID=A0A5C6CXU0_9BACT|nr:LacI family DNA-binding transcriptional regulator [Bythopirellula polymerisocia]TWU28357.1 HTH-type transcriptional regulator DegA [Bythopirellula polymerisocia]